MIVPYLRTLAWDEPPAAMEFSLSYAALLESVADLVEGLSFAATDAASAAPDNAVAERAATLYARVPGIVNVMLNHKICVEHGLPLHPTVYYELKEARRYRIDHDLHEIDHANRLYLASIDLAQAALRLAPDFRERLRAFMAGLPAPVRGFVFTGIRDKYTWRGSDPALLERLASTLKKTWEPDLVIAAAHGSIGAGLLLAELLEKPLYFIRFSMFKRYDEEPIVTFSDEAWLYSYRAGKALLYDEDVAGGRTLTLFTEKLSPLFAETRTACSIRHAGSSIKPDFAARIWWD